MKIATHVLAYNVNRFLKEVLENMEPHVDKIYIAYSEKPWGYVNTSRNNSTNPTKLSDVILASASKKIELVQGDWLTEEEMRNECLNRARVEGFDWFLVQDADEFYTEESWDQIKRTLLRNKSDDHFKTTWYNFWKSSQYVLVYPNGSIKHTNASFAFRCKSNINFVRKRWHMDNSTVLDYPCYHYGYVMSDIEMEEKISTWGHANELFAKSWYKYKWKNWNESTIYLHPTNPFSWSKAIRFPLQQPPFAEHFFLPTLLKQNDYLDIAGDNIYNTNVILFESKKKVKRLIKGLIS